MHGRQLLKLYTTKVTFTYYDTDDTNKTKELEISSAKFDTLTI